MTVVRRLARPMLAAIFIQGGLDAVRRPEAKADAAGDLPTKIAGRVPYLPKDPVQLVRLNGAVMLGAGTMLAVGKLPRLAAVLLIGSLLPTTVAGHRFWEYEDRRQRLAQRQQFVKNFGLLGGLLLAAVDTEGRPGLAWRTRRAAKDARRAARIGARTARVGARSARREAALGRAKVRARVA